MLDRPVLKEHQMFLVSDARGDIAAHNVDGQGLYWRDTRFLSLYELRLGTGQPQLLSSAGEHNFMTTLQFANPAFTTIDGHEVPARSISIRRNRFLHGALHERIGMFNYNRFPVQVRVSLAVGSDYRDMFDVRGYARRSKHGSIDPPRHDGDAILLGYTGLDGLRRETKIHVDRAPSSVEIDEGPQAPSEVLRTLPGISGAGDPRVESGIRPPTATLHFDLTLAPGQHDALTIHVVPRAGGERPMTVDDSSLDAAFAVMRKSYADWEERCTSIATDDEVVNAVVHRSLHDLRLLSDRVPEGFLPSAGIPWFSVPFGRDSLITAMQTLVLQPEIARATLLFLARHQGTEVNDFRDEQPGKILHEIRLGELATLGQVPHTPYYGSVDSTPLWLIALGQYLDWTADWEVAARLRPNVDAALRWIDEYGDLDGDGYVEYVSRSASGIRNQGWKDSHDAISFSDGRPAEPPIALAEVQGYVYAAWIAAARYLEHFGERDRAEQLRARALDLRVRFMRDWWLPREQSFALALDAQKQLVPSVSSNVGHCLWAGMLDEATAKTVAERLMREDMLCGWGIRTLSSMEATFNPMSYHNGSVWPHDNSLIVAGLKRYGMDANASIVAQEVLEAAVRFPGFRLPELYCGFARDRRYFSMPAQYPVSCSPQAWAAGSIFLILQSLLGLRADASSGRLWLRPRLVHGINRVGVRRLRVGRHVVDFDVVRDGDQVRVDVLGSGGLGIVVEPPPGGAS
ncbi:MAG: amylo-alpha-1,6-glucosidase [Chloroflexota bacterium]|nr:amylo-alpha-1,6-glucosidase [Chloroflexota bacterium]